MQGNRGDIGHVHKKEVDEVKDLQSEKDILQLFLINNSGIKIIILFSKWVDHNSKCDNLAAVKNKIKNRRITRNIGNTSNSSSVSTSHEKQSKREKRKRKNKSITFNKKKDKKKLD